MSPKVLRSISFCINLFFLFHLFFAGLFYYLSGFLFDDNKVRLSIAFIAFFIPAIATLYIDDYADRLEGVKSSPSNNLGCFFMLLVSVLFFHFTYYLTKGQTLISILAGVGSFILTAVLYTNLHKNKKGK